MWKMKSEKEKKGKKTKCKDIPRKRSMLGDGKSSKIAAIRNIPFNNKGIWESRKYIFMWECYYV